MSQIGRETAAGLGREAVEIAEGGEYRAPSGRVLVIRDAVARAVAGTRSHPPDEPIAARAGDAQTIFEVVNESTLACARRLAVAGTEPVALNFASARKPGGGFLSGARAQEESLARASALHACLAAQPMYAHHSARRDAMYTSWAIYSPGVPVFRGAPGDVGDAPIPGEDTDEETLLEEPWTCAFITAPAVNAKVVLERDASRRAEIRAAMDDRVARVLGIAALHGHRRLVLGAWGCGVFGNEPAEIAELFRTHMLGAFRGAFEHVAFAILDSSEEQRFIAPFRRAFADVSSTRLWRPVGPRERELIAATKWRRFPPRLPEQPIFYPVCNERYAREIASRWNVAESGGGWVTRFRVRDSVLAKYPVQKVGTRHHLELWIPAEDLETVNDAIVGPIEVVAEYLPASS